MFCLLFMINRHELVLTCYENECCSMKCRNGSFHAKNINTGKANLTSRCGPPKNLLNLNFPRFLIKTEAHLCHNATIVCKSETTHDLTQWDQMPFNLQKLVFTLG